LATIRSNLYEGNKLPAADVIFNSSVNPYARDENPEQMTILRNGRLATAKTDQRVKLDLGAGNRTFFTNKILEPLVSTAGVVFPYTPQLVVTHSANYIATPITHANFQHYTYSNSDIAAIQINGDFTGQKQEEGRYVYAVIHFFRTVTKMFFGTGGSDPTPVATPGTPTPFATPGTPPPILFLSAHGALFKKVPVVLTNFTSTFPSDVNYLPVTLVKGTPVQVPTMMTLSVTLQPVFNRKQAQTFDLSKFATGNLLDKGYI
jgi:hypothetical protein